MPFVIWCSLISYLPDIETPCFSYVFCTCSSLNTKTFCVVCLCVCLDTLGLNASDTQTLDNITSGNPTNNIHYKEEISTPVPLLSDRDYLLTRSSSQYALLFNLRQKLDSSKFFVRVNAVQGSLSESLFVIIVQNRTTLFYSNNSIFGLFKLASVSSWQKLVVSFDHREISLTQECAEFSYLPLPSKPKLEEWEKVMVTAQMDNSEDNIQVSIRVVSLTLFFCFVYNHHKKF